MTPGKFGTAVSVRGLHAVPRPEPRQMENDQRGEAMPEGDQIPRRSLG